MTTNRYSPPPNVSTKSPPVLIEKNYADLDISDITSCLRFDLKTGSVWLHDERSLLLRGSIYSQMRAQLINALGRKEARKSITTMGYKAGLADAQLAEKIRGKRDLEALLTAAHQFFSMEGMGEHDLEIFKVDPEKGDFFVNVVSTTNIEDDLHIEQFGVGHTPVCWHAVGYATGYLSTAMGAPIIVREPECRAMGNVHCRYVGKPVEDWGTDLGDELDYYGIPQLIKLKGKKRSPKRRRSEALATPKTQLADPEISDELVGSSTGFISAIQILKKVAPTDATVLFIGETGVGKEIFSKTLHKISLRAEKPLIAVNCAAIPEELIESELFGVDKGAFTGATQSRPGRFERANTGTLFLDEVSSLSLSAQGKLLRLLQEGELERLGGTEVKQIDIRIIAATNVDLHQEVKAGRFREDLYYRLNVFPIHIPPLRGRREDIELLANTFFAKYSKKYQRQPSGFSMDALEALLCYDWPGNIRELENLVERAVVLAPEGQAIQINHLFTSDERISSQIYSPDKQGQLIHQSNEPNLNQMAEALLEHKSPLESMESIMVDAALQRTKGNISQAARLLGITRGQLGYRLKKESH